jgi:hypothetical protein
VQLLKENEMEDDRPLNSVLNKMTLQDQKALYSVPNVDADSAVSNDGDSTRPDGGPPSSV